MSSEPNQAVLEQKMGAAYAALGGMLNAAMIHIGDDLGLYRAMNGAGSLTAEELAGKSRLAERFVHEWLYQQAGAGIIEHRGAGRFEMLPEAGMVFADETFPLGMGPSLKYLPHMFSLALGSAGAFRTGLGRTYDDAGEQGAKMIDAFFGAWNRTSLASEALPRLDGVVERLRNGGKVADVGCGAGAAAIALAGAFPAAEIHGYDNSVEALRVAEESRQREGVSNVTFHNPDHDPLPGGPTFDLVMTLDCLHDMTRPDLVAAAIRRSITPGGTWFIVDIDSAPTAADNLQNPMAGMMYAMSLSMCLQSSASTPDGLGLGPMGLPEPAMRKLASDAGFPRFGRVDGLIHPMNAYYAARP